MLKLRLKRIGRKRSPFYRLVIMENTTRRNGSPVDEVGYYNPITKNYYFQMNKIIKWLKVGAQPTKTTKYLLNKSEILNL